MEDKICFGFNQLNYAYFNCLIQEAPEKSKVTVVETIIQYYYSYKDSILRNQINIALDELLCPLLSRGRQCIEAYLVEVIIKRNNPMRHGVMYTYEILSNQFEHDDKSTPTSVERAIRIVINKLISEKENEEIKEKIFGENYKKIKLTNSLFLAYLTKYLIHENEFFEAHISYLKKIYDPRAGGVAI